MRKFPTTYNEMGALGDWRSRQMLGSREQPGGSILFVVLASMSHEIRTPLNGILGMLDPLRSS